MIERRERVFVYALLAVLAVPGIVGFELWPASGWRLFSLARDSTQTVWVLEAESSDGERRRVSLEELPVAYRLADWVLAELPRSSGERREEVCRALLDAAREVRGDVARFHIVRDRQRLERVSGGTRRISDREPVHSCGERA